MPILSLYGIMFGIFSIYPHPEGKMGIFYPICTVSSVPTVYVKGLGPFSQKLGLVERPKLIQACS